MPSTIGRRSPRPSSSRCQLSEGIRHRVGGRLRGMVSRPTDGATLVASLGGERLPLRTARVQMSGVTTAPTPIPEEFRTPIAAHDRLSGHPALMRLKNPMTSTSRSVSYGYRAALARRHRCSRSQRTVGGRRTIDAGAEFASSTRMPTAHDHQRFRVTFGMLLDCGDDLAPHPVGMFFAPAFQSVNFDRSIRLIALVQQRQLRLSSDRIRLVDSVKIAAFSISRRCRLGSCLCRQFPLRLRALV